METINPNERLLNVAEVANFLNVSELTIRRWTNAGKLKCYRIGVRNERRFSEGDLLEFVNGSKEAK